MEKEQALEILKNTILPDEVPDYFFATIDFLTCMMTPCVPKRNPEDPYQWYCPRCESIIGVDGQDPYNDFCCDCGQALYWDEEEDTK